MKTPALRFIVTVLVLTFMAATAPPAKAGAESNLSINRYTLAIKDVKFLTANGLEFGKNVASVNAKTVAATNIFQVKARFYVTRIQIETTAATAITAGAVVTVGSTGTAANSILANTTLANTPVVGGYETFLPKAGALPLAAGDILTVSVGTGATGTSQTIRPHVYGYYGGP